MIIVSQSGDQSFLSTLILSMGTGPQRVRIVLLKHGKEMKSKKFSCITLLQNMYFRQTVLQWTETHHTAVTAMNIIVQSIELLLNIGQCTSTSSTIILQNTWRDSSNHQPLQEECSSGTLLTSLTCHTGMLAMGIVVIFAM